MHEQMRWAPNRRQVLRGGAALGSAFFVVPGLFAEELIHTPAQTPGPFYPDRLPLDTDNDLLIINDSLTPAVGEITHLTGRILDARGEPVRNAVVEIWQVDGQGAYLHRDSANAEKRDRGFQGFGRFLTGSTGAYYFRTLKPVAYPGRTPHIHVAVKLPGHEPFTTQLYNRAEAEQNARDAIYRSVRDAQQRESLTVAFAPVEGSRIGELAANFDVVLGFTPEM